MDDYIAWKMPKIINRLLASVGIMAAERYAKDVSSTGAVHIDANELVKKTTIQQKISELSGMVGSDSDDARRG